MNDRQTRPVRTETDHDPAHCTLTRDSDGIAWLSIDRADARVNTLSTAVLDALDQQFIALAADPPQGLIIQSAKSNGFIAGADVHEFVGLADQAAVFQQICHAHGIFDRLESLPCPSVALIEGFCLGGGTELALACRYRVACDEPATRIGLPEVRLGIHPGYGGTVRLPERVGSLRAMGLMLSGSLLSAKTAHRIGLVDYALPERHLGQAARWLVLNDPGPQQARWYERLPASRPLRPLVAAYLRRQVRKRARPDHYPAPDALIDLWTDHGADPQTQPEAEAHSVATLVTGATAQNLIRAFVLREKLQSQGRQEVRPIHHVHVIGAGAMGGDIAAWCALQGLRVSLQDQSAQCLAPALQRAHDLFQMRLRDRRLVMAAMDRLLPDVAADGLSRADLVIEAIVEDRDAKQALYAKIEPKLREDALLATNTSSIPLEDLGGNLTRPERLVGLHFFNPVAKMQLVEVVRGAATSDESVERAAAFVRQIDRLSLPVASTPGFLVNRVLTPYLLEAVLLLDDGVPAEAVDAAALDFGMPMGPVALADSVGLDICLSVARNLFARNLPGNNSDPIPESLRRKVAAGALGRKSGEGFYRYGHGGPHSSGHAQAPADTQDRLILRLLNEAVHCLRDRVVADADLLDAGLIYGTGFAPFRGGPMHYIRQTEPDALHRRLVTLAERYGERFQPDPGWQELEP